MVRSRHEFREIEKKKLLPNLTFSSHLICLWAGNPNIKGFIVSAIMSPSSALYFMQFSSVVLKLCLDGTNESQPGL